jgi:hypothetical protein
MGRLSANWLKKHKFAPGDAFIQTGTQNGIALKYVAPLFKTIHTIELDRRYFTDSADLLSKFKNITCHHGSSPVVLPKVIDRTRQTLFWLDAHYTATDTCQYQVKDQCPLLWELSAIFNARWQAPMTILVDDAHMHQPSFWRQRWARPYDRRQWPKQRTIETKCREFGYDLRQIDDVFVIEKRT